MRTELDKLLIDFGAALSPHEHHQYIPKLRDYLVPYILNEKRHVSSLESLFKNEFTRNDVIKSTEYYVVQNKNVRSKGSIDDFLIALNQLSVELLNEKYPNPNLRNIQPYTKLNQEVEANLERYGRILKDREANPAIDENQFLHLCNILNSDLTDSHKSLQVTVIIKLILLYGFKFNRIADFTLEDFDVERRLLKVKREQFNNETIDLELPYSLYLDLKKYHELRITLKTDNNLLFLTSIFTTVNPSFLNDILNKARDTYYDKKIIDSSLKNPFTTTGLSKFAIINMILEGINQSTIIDITGVNEIIYRNCQETVNGELKGNYNRYINYKLRAIQTYDIL
ncbi:hypothetical protein SAMN03159341_1047 [Paenibacillus sp. 1_12]|uniref:hypothetical protein n=1 Tax=Paenibacillus sp. 1_12 TaxID=1566278 RepID=UPI0008DFB5A9|nr:hypothetical protein [Paenibacillus sp. 1_12]SFL20748.1 hypothetical protein SAMN03159341_1047 [Paenibacillus sp. 1_12]